MIEPSGRFGDWIQVGSGGRFWPLDPRPEEVDIGDIARGLAHQGRFTGQGYCFYSIAQHSVLVSRYCDPDDAFWGLLHDAPEAYLADLSRPIKNDPTMIRYREAEGVLMGAICTRFGLSREMPASVHRADNLLLAAEAKVLFSSLDPGWSRWIEGIDTTGVVVDPVGPDEARIMFLERFLELVPETSPRP